MAGSSLLALIDDIATILDDVSILTKVAAKKTSGVLGDDLALNAEQVSGVNADRELPVVWAVAKGSFLNKLILVPSALAISTFAAFLIQPLLLAGGAFLCFEGAEKIWEKLFHKKKKEIEPIENENTLNEKDKIKGAIRTDFILSAEIIVITLGSVAHADLTTRILVLCGIAILMTVGVYGLVAAIVKLDDLGLNLINHPLQNPFKKMTGTLILKLAPLLMKFLGIAGTIAMFLVGGGLIAHNFQFLHHFQESLTPIFKVGFEGSLGFLTGVLILAMALIYKKIRLKI